MSALDLLIIAAYVGGVVVFGAWISRTNRSVRDYFVGRRAVPWWAVGGSIVATETSTITFVSVPGFAFTGDFTFLQLAFGYIAGRIVVAIIFVPAYVRGELLTVYELLGRRFGAATRRLTSALFLTTRSLADGLRLFATGLVLAALFRAAPVVSDAVAAAMPGVPADVALLVAATVVVGLATILYTYLGGMLAVIWTDVVQLAIYVGGAVAAVVILAQLVPGGLTGALEAAQADGRLRLFDFVWDLARGYTFWSGLVGGAFLTMATHGTDQLIVQRYLCSRSVRQAQAAVVVSGFVVLVQFALFLLIGTLLFAYYQAVPHELEAVMVAGRVAPDRIFPAFIVTHLPPGLTGLVVAAVFAAAMSTLSSSLNSSSAASVGDFYVPATGGRYSDAHYLFTGRLLTAGWGGVQIAVAIGAVWLSTRVIDEALGIASFTNGVILGIFLLGTFTRAGERAALAGVATGAAFMLALRIGTAVNWQWYVLFGAAATFAAGLLVHHLTGRRQER